MVKIARKIVSQFFYMESAMDCEIIKNTLFRLFFALFIVKIQNYVYLCILYDLLGCFAVGHIWFGSLVQGIERRFPKP